jgi:hypothetical protein
VSIIEFDTGTDPLWRDVPLDHVLETSALGIPLRVESNSPNVTSIAAQAYGSSRDRATHVEATAGVRLRVVIEPGITDVAAGTPVVWRFPDRDHALVHASGLMASIDLARGEAIAYVEEAFARRSTHFRYTVIEGLVLVLLARHDRHAVHAAALRSGDSLLLLHGPTGSGKSTLCYLAHQAGIEVLAEDVVWVQCEPELRVWGFGERVHLLEDAREAFPELRDHGVIRSAADGERKLAIAIPSPNGRRALPFGRRARVCLLSRNGRNLSRTTVSPEEIQRRLLDVRETAFDMTPERSPIVARALAADGGWCLNLSSSPHEAVPHLRAMLEQVASGTALGEAGLA